MQLRYFNQPHFENGSLKLISQVLKEQGITKPLICTDPGLVAIGMMACPYSGRSFCL